MGYEPSVITFFSEDSKVPQKSVLSEHSIISKINIRQISHIESICASIFTLKKETIRPVVLSSIYENELIYGSKESFLERAFFSGKNVFQVDLSESVLYNDLNFAVKASLRAEKAIIQQLEQNEIPVPSLYYFTTEKKAFFISMPRLLGEILKAQRKIEKVRERSSPLVQKSMDSFLKKLCSLKILGDRAVFGDRNVSLLKDLS